MNGFRKQIREYLSGGPDREFILTTLINGGRVIECGKDDLVILQDIPNTVYALGSFTDSEVIREAATVMTDNRKWFEEHVGEVGEENTLIAQNVLYAGDMPERIVPEGTSFRLMDESDIPFLMEDYDGFDADEAYMSRCIERGMLCIEKNGLVAGYIGVHDEGAMGLLHIKPEYRRMHYGEALETEMIRMLMEKGYPVWGQVVGDNTASRRLQEKLGLVWSGWYYWIFR